MTRAALEARPQPLIHGLQFPGRPVTGQDDLFVHLVQNVEGVKKLLLSLLFGGQHLDIINQPNIYAPVGPPEVLHPLVSKGRHIVIGERLPADIGHSRLRQCQADLVPDGMGKMSLSQAGAAV